MRSGSRADRIPLDEALAIATQIADGTRFLVRERVDDSLSRMDIRIVLNWLEEVRGKIP